MGSTRPEPAQSEWPSGHSTRRKRKWWKVSDLSSVDLLLGQLSWFASVGPDMLLKNQSVGVLLVADGALVKHSHGRLCSVDAHVGLEVALGGECPAADPALERPLASVRAVVHLKRRLARQHPVADDALVGIRQLVLDVVDQLLELAGLAGFADFDQRLPGVVVAAWPRKKVGVNVGIFCRVKVTRETQGK